jgi:hypothetical protein
MDGSGAVVEGKCFAPARAIAAPIREGYRGVAALAPLVTLRPIPLTSCPAPATVLQADSSEPVPNSSNTVRNKPAAPLRLLLLI